MRNNFDQNMYKTRDRFISSSLYEYNDSVYFGNIFNENSNNVIQIISIYIFVLF